MFCLLLTLVASAMAALRSPMVNAHRARLVEYMANSGSASAVQTPPAQWFTQRLDHFNAQDNRVWQQRYYVNDSFFNAGIGGPVFFQIGGEGAISSFYVTDLQYVYYAQQMGALIVSLEHRFYGESHPLPDMSTPNLVYLSSQQALSDAAVFIEFIHQQYPTATDVISFGGSYPGALAAWFRAKFPSSTAASIASSAPVLAVEDMVSYLDVVDRSLAIIGGPACDAAVRNASAVLDAMLATTSGQAQVAKDFNSCAPFSDQRDIANFLGSVIGNFMGVVQYNAEIAGSVTIGDLCKQMLSPSATPYQNYVTISNQFLSAQGQTCMDNSYSDMIAQLKNVTSWGQTGVGIRQWTYQTCAEFGYFQTTDGANQPFGTGIPLSFYVDICKDVYGKQMAGGPRINFTNAYYGGNKPYGATRIVFVNGNIDPWSSLSVLKDLTPSLTAIVVDGGAHCSNMFHWVKGMNINIKHAQAEISKRIQKFLTDGPQ